MGGHGTIPLSYCKEGARFGILCSVFGYFIQNSHIFGFSKPNSCTLLGSKSCFQMLEAMEKASVSQSENVVKWRSEVAKIEDFCSEVKFWVIRVVAGVPPPPSFWVFTNFGQGLRVLVAFCEREEFEQ